MAITIKSAREIELMSEAGRILEIVHNELASDVSHGDEPGCINLGRGIQHGL